ncbi:MAG: mannose-1-phosphate guanyltransferase, partial [Treponema sp. GWA1_62_8]
ACLSGTDGSVVVVAGAAHLDRVARACAAYPASDRERVALIGEKVARNTAPAIACAATYLLRTKGKGRRALVVTSDHIIGPLASFVTDARAADALAAEGKLVVFGIPPAGPETGFGYVETAAALPSADAAGRAFSLASFREKPDRATAERFLASGKFYWNSGMFGFSVDFLMEEFERNSPETLAPFAALAAPRPQDYERRDGVAVLSSWTGLDQAYAAVKGISFDYAIAEKCASAAVIAASFDWTDIGCWDDYARAKEAGPKEQAEASAASGAAREPAAREPVAPVFSSNASRCFVDSDLPVALCGVEDLIVVVRSGADGSPGSVLVCRKGESQRVKEIVEAAKAAGRSDLL